MDSGDDVRRRSSDRARPGTTVKADTVILELSNPQLEQELQDAELKLQAAEAALANLRVQMQNDLLQQQRNRGEHRRRTTRRPRCRRR